MIDVIYTEPLSDKDLLKTSLPRRRVKVSWPAFFASGDIRKMAESIYVASGVNIFHELKALLDDGKPIGPAFRRHAALLHPSGWGVYNLGADREFTPASPKIHVHNKAALAAVRTMDAKGGHLTVLWTDRSAVATVLDVSEDFVLVLSPFGEQGVWRSQAGYWRTAVPSATGRLLGRSRVEAVIAAGEMVGLRLESAENAEEPKAGSDYVKFAGLSDVYDVDDCTQEVLA